MPAHSSGPRASALGCARNRRVGRLRVGRRRHAAPEAHDADERNYGLEPLPRVARRTFELLLKELVTDGARGLVARVALRYSSQASSVSPPALWPAPSGWPACPPGKGGPLAAHVQARQRPRPARWQVAAVERAGYQLSVGVGAVVEEQAHGRGRAGVLGRASDSSDSASLPESCCHSCVHGGKRSPPTCSSPSRIRNRRHSRSCCI